MGTNKVIKVPVYSSTPIENNDDDLFGCIDFQKMERSVEELILNYKEDSERRVRRGKNQETVIKSVAYTIKKFDDRNWILLRISAYETNYEDGYVVTKSKHNLTPDDKIGKDTYFVLLVPNIIGYEQKKGQWLFFIYDDPNKESKEVIRISKIAITKILKQKIFNIKLEAILADISKVKRAPELNIKYNSLTHDGKIDEKYREYWISSNLKKYKEDKFSNLPAKVIEDMISDHNYQKKYQKREIQLILGEKEYHIIREEAKEVFKEAAEEVYNYQIEISDKEYNCKEGEKHRIYDENFILDKLSPIVYKYFER